MGIMGVFFQAGWTRFKIKFNSRLPSSSFLGTAVQLYSVHTSSSWEDGELVFSSAEFGDKGTLLSSWVSSIVQRRLSLSEDPEWFCRLPEIV